MQTRSIGPISSFTSCCTWSGSPRSARMPPCILGCSVLTRPPRISGAPVTSETGTTSTPASESALAVPPVEMISNPIPESRRAKSSTPRLSETETRALRFIPLPPQEIVSDRPDEQPVLHGMQPLQQRLLGVFGPYGHPFLRHDGSSVHFLDHEMNRHARLLDPSLERTLHRPEPAEVGQQRGMDVQHGGETLQEDG